MVDELFSQSRGLCEHPPHLELIRSEQEWQESEGDKL
jgi:hypothetical protein